MMTKSFSLLLFVAAMMMTLMANAAPLKERGLKDTLARVKGNFIGKATFFKPKEEGGPTGACGPHEEDSSKIVALNLPQYGNENKISDWCFKKVLITSDDGKSTEATITDACPGCQEKSLDLTPSVFEKLGPKEKGVLNINWCVIGSDGCTGGGSEKVVAPSKGKRGY